MKEISVIEGNKLIAEFMGNKRKESLSVWLRYKHWTIEPFGYFDDCDLKYNSSWEWIMPVVEKIELLGYEVQISSQMESINDDRETIWHQDCIITDSVNEITDITSSSKINSVYQAIIKFITWYNT